MYAIQVSKAATKALSNLPKAYRQRIAQRIDALAQNPRPRGCEPIKGAKDSYRLRFGPYRMIYEIRDKVLCVIVVTIAHRKESYR